MLFIAGLALCSVAVTMVWMDVYRRAKGRYRSPGRRIAFSLIRMALLISGAILIALGRTLGE